MKETFDDIKFIPAPSWPSALSERANRILEARPQKDFKIFIRFDDGSEAVLDFLPVIQSGGVMTSLADPVVFMQAVIGEDGSSLVFPGAIDFCADALWLKAKDQFV